MIAWSSSRDTPMVVTCGPKDACPKDVSFILLRLPDRSQKLSKMAKDIANHCERSTFESVWHLLLHTSHITLIIHFKCLSHTMTEVKEEYTTGPNHVECFAWCKRWKRSVMVFPPKSEGSSESKSSWYQAVVDSWCCKRLYWHGQTLYFAKEFNSCFEQWKIDNSKSDTLLIGFRIYFHTIRIIPSSSLHLGANLNGGITLLLPTNHDGK